MTAWTTTLTYNSTDPMNCTWSDPINPGGFWAVNMQQGDTLTISFSGFPIGEVVPFTSHLRHVNLTGGGNTIIFPPPQDGPDFSITASMPNLIVTDPGFSVTITDNQDPKIAVEYSLTVSGNVVADNGAKSAWSSGDPEVINNPG